MSRNTNMSSIQNDQNSKDREGERGGRRERIGRKYTDAWRQVGFLMHVTHLWYFQETVYKSIVRGAEEIFLLHIRGRGYQKQATNQHINPLPGNFRIQDMCFYDLHVICDLAWRLLLEWDSYTFLCFFISS